jgi:ABC-type transport system involved in cytochrome c biogenesis permease subunit
MAIKYTIQGLLIYTAIAGYLLAFVVSLLGGKKAGRLLQLLGFITALFALAYRWYHVGHIPLQNLFEVFLALGMAVYPLGLFCRNVLRTQGRLADMLIGSVVLFPAGFVFNARPQQLPPALQSWLFGPHVAVYMLAYIFMAKAACHAAVHIAGKTQPSDENSLSPERSAHKMICVGFPLLTLGLILGSCWGKLAWGDYWGWDPKELWSLASWLLYAAYFHFHSVYGRKFTRINCLWALAGMAIIVITMLWVNLSRLFAGLHSYAV